MISQAGGAEKGVILSQASLRKATPSLPLQSGGGVGGRMPLNFLMPPLPSSNSHCDLAHVPRLASRSS